jgi:uncharacterized protein
MKKIILPLIITICVLGIGIGLYLWKFRPTIITPIGIYPKPKPLLLYTFNKLKQTRFPENQITLGRKTTQNDTFQSQMFYFSVPKQPGSNHTLPVSGLMNLPNKPGNYPVILMFRGYVPTEIFQSGIGTQPSASVFAQHGFITLAPDFLGFGESASPSADPFEERFQTYTTALTLLSSIQTLNNALETSYSGSINADLSHIGIWGHSNGGHIALSALAISGVNYPTVLWAPVSKSFPYSILYYTDEADDQGKALRSVLAKFEKDYDTELFSPTNYYSWIKAPIEIHQGTADQEVPVWWSNELVNLMKKDKIDVTYITHPGDDHNLLPSGWSDTVNESMDFFKNNFKK